MIQDWPSGSFHVNCDCGRSGPLKATSDAAWAAWDADNELYAELDRRQARIEELERALRALTEADTRRPANFEEKHHALTIARAALKESETRGKA